MVVGRVFCGLPRACARLTPRARRGRLPESLAILMSQADPIRLFVTHRWEDSDDYLRVFEYLESTPNFYYRNLSTPDRRPSGDKEALKEDLRRQMANAEAVIGLVSLYERNQDMVTFQLLYAQACQKPVILLKYFGLQRPVPKPLSDLADDVVDWDQRALVDSVRRQARHQDSTRWDTIEFKLD
jgi:hypothetical protein